MTPEELAATRSRLIHKGITRLLPVLLTATALLYVTAAYLGQRAERQREQEVEQVVQRGETRIASLAVGSPSPAIPRERDTDEAIAALRERYGVEGDDIPSYTWRGTDLFICPSKVEPDECSPAESHAFALAYTYKVDVRGGLDDWNLVFAPVRDGHFTPDQARVLYRINTSGAKVAVLTASADFGEGSLPREPFVGQLNDFSDSALGRQLEAAADDESADALNPLGLRLAEMRIERFVGSAPIPLPGGAQIAAAVEGPVADFGAWLWADGNATEFLSRILQLLAIVGVLAAVLRAVFAFASFAMDWSFEWLELYVAKRASERKRP